MTKTPAEIAMGLTNADLAPFAYDAAIQWCGEKERETFPEDIAYFMNNWRWAAGFRARVERLAIRALQQKGPSNG